MCRASIAGVSATRARISESGVVPVRTRDRGLAAGERLQRAADAAADREFGDGRDIGGPGDAISRSRDTLEARPFPYRQRCNYRES
jgi:hypothetical protein